MKRYIDAILQARAQDKKNPEGTIIADIVARDLPTEKQASNDSGHGGRSDMIAEVKTMQPGKNAYEKGNSQDNKPVNQRAKRVTKATETELPNSIANLHQTRSEPEPTARWAHSRRPWGNSTPEMFSPSLSARSAKSTRTQTSSSKN